MAVEGVPVASPGSNGDTLRSAVGSLERWPTSASACIVSSSPTTGWRREVTVQARVKSSNDSEPISAAAISYLSYSSRATSQLGTAIGTVLHCPVSTISSFHLSLSSRVRVRSDVSSI